MQQLDPVTGPVPREVFKTLAGLPCGEAAKLIRKYDPLFGLEQGKKITWEVKVVANRMTGTATVEAASEKEAERLAEDLSDYDVDWHNLDDFDILSIEPARIQQ